MARASSAGMGAYSAAKLEYLGAARDCGAIGVNRRHCRPLHPHGFRMMRDGLMRLTRNGLPSCRHSALVITEEGLTELARLEARAAARLRKHGAPDWQTPSKPITRRSKMSAAAIAFSKAAIANSKAARA